jgi:hypothetical protein
MCTVPSVEAQSLSLSLSLDLDLFSLSRQSQTETIVTFAFLEAFASPINPPDFFPPPDAAAPAML